MADGHDPEAKTLLSEFLAEGIKSREDVETAMMAAIVRQTHLLKALTSITGFMMDWFDKTHGAGEGSSDTVRSEMKKNVEECEQINIALLDYIVQSQKDPNDAER